MASMYGAPPQRVVLVKSQKYVHTHTTSQKAPPPPTGPGVLDYIIALEPVQQGLGRRRRRGQQLLRRARHAQSPVGRRRDPCARRALRHRRDGKLPDAALLRRGVESSTTSGRRCRLRRAAPQATIVSRSSCSSFFASRVRWPIGFRGGGGASPALPSVWLQPLRWPASRVLLFRPAPARELPSVDGVLADTDGVLHRISTTPVRHRRASAQRDRVSHDTSTSTPSRRRRRRNVGRRKTRTRPNRTGAPGLPRRPSGPSAFCTRRRASPRDSFGRASSPPVRVSLVRRALAAAGRASTYGTPAPATDVGLLAPELREQSRAIGERRDIVDRRAVRRNNLIDALIAAPFSASARSFASMARHASAEVAFSLSFASAIISAWRARSLRDWRSSIVPGFCAFAFPWLRGLRR